MSDISFNTACKELKIAQIAQLNQLFKLLHLAHIYAQGEIIYLLVFKEIVKISQRFLSYLSCKVKCLKSLKVGGVI